MVINTLAFHFIFFYFSRTHTHLLIREIFQISRYFIQMTHETYNTLTSHAPFIVSYGSRSRILCGTILLWRNTEIIPFPDMNAYSSVCMYGAPTLVTIETIAGAIYEMSSLISSVGRVRVIMMIITIECETIPRIHVLLPYVLCSPASQL